MTSSTKTPASTTTSAPGLQHRPSQTGPWCQTHRHRTLLHQRRRLGPLHQRPVLLPVVSVPTSSSSTTPSSDESASTSMQVIRDYMSRLPSRSPCPWCSAGAGIDWTATFVSKRHYAWSAMSTVKNEKGETVAEDPASTTGTASSSSRPSPDPADPTCHISCWGRCGPSSIESPSPRASLTPSPSPRSASAWAPPPRRRDAGQARRLRLDLLQPRHLPPGRHSWWLESVDDSSPPALLLLRHHLLALQRLPQHLPSASSSVPVASSSPSTPPTPRTPPPTARPSPVSPSAPTTALLPRPLVRPQARPEPVRRAMMMAQRWHASAINIEVVRGSYKPLRTLLLLRHHGPPPPTVSPTSRPSARSSPAPPPRPTRSAPRHPLRAAHHQVPLVPPPSRPLVDPSPRPDRRLQPRRTRRRPREGR